MAHRRSIPVRLLPEEFINGIVIEKISPDVFYLDEGLGTSHRHDYHMFLLQEKGLTHTEIDFEEYIIRETSIMYLSPSQVHRGFKAEDMEVYMLIIKSENINSDYLKLLQRLSPLRPLAIKLDDLLLIKKAFEISLQVFEKTRDKLYSTLLRDCCNTVIGLLISEYIKDEKKLPVISRFQRVAKAFSLCLEDNYKCCKSPAEYAMQLNIATSYLNECVKNVTGFPVSHHIQQRVILEAKRMLYHSDRSVKEISIELGYDDYSYFSRMFKKLTGMTAIDFRYKNHV